MRHFAKIPKKISGGGFVTFYDVVDTGWIEQTDNDLEATSVNFNWGSRLKYDLTQVGDYFEYIEGSAYGFWVDNPNGNLYALGLNKNIFDNAGGYGNNATNNIGAYSASTGNTVRWEIVDVGGGVLKLRFKNITTATDLHTSSYTLNLSGGNRVEGRFGPYGDAIGAVFTKPVVRSGGVIY
jgi:hypothetical protein